MATIDSGGFFSNEWLSLATIHTALKRASPITAVLLQPSFRGKSVNTPGYLLAVLRAEKLIRTLPNKSRVHELSPEWESRVAELSGDSAQAPSRTPPKASPAKPSIPRPKPASKPKRK